MTHPTSENETVQTFEVWSVSRDNMAELVIQRQGMGPTDFEQYVPTTDDVFVRWTDYQRLRAALVEIKSQHLWGNAAMRIASEALSDDSPAVETTERHPTAKQLGVIFFRYIDRLNDATPEDPIEKTVNEMLSEANALIVSGQSPMEIPREPTAGEAASFDMTLARSPRRVPDETLDRSKPDLIEKASAPHTVEDDYTQVSLDALYSISKYGTLSPYWSAGVLIRITQELYAARKRALEPEICYFPCEKHMGVPVTMTVGPPTRPWKQVCPVCEPPT